MGQSVRPRASVWGVGARRNAPGRGRADVQCPLKPLVPPGGSMVRRSVVAPTPIWAQPGMPLPAGPLVTLATRDLLSGARYATAGVGAVGPAPSPFRFGAGRATGSGTLPKSRMG